MSPLHRALRSTPLSENAGRPSDTAGRPFNTGRRSTAAALIATAGLVMAGCSTDPEVTSGSQAITVRASDSACEVDRTDLTAGTNVMKVTNTGSKVTEVYVYTKNGQIVTERENIGPGLGADVTFEVAAGEYEIACKPGQVGDGIRQAVKVTGDGGDTVTKDQRLVDAVARYRAYAQQQADQGLPLVQKFTTAVKEGDLKTAREVYAPSREGWERVEPVAESFGDLDPLMDIREADLEPGQEWTGWHRLEKAVFTTKSTTGQATYADRLLADYRTFQRKVATAKITPTSMANGAKELLDEVATGKITGEEDIWSGTDLWDFAANVEGARKAYELLREVVGDNDPALRTQLDRTFDDLQQALQEYRQGAGYVNYRTVDDAERKVLSQKVNALAEPLSKLAASVARR
ncbi:MAG: iron uptake system protein EfeO [Angustibacter sp.]